VANNEKIFKTNLNILNIDSISASPENIAQGKYKLLYTIGIVFHPKFNQNIQNFINYIFSDLGKQKLGDSGYILMQQP
jgi:ABC-type phosphate transport system substrate-binding protein